jgi:hypothetical protein
MNDLEKTQPLQQECPPEHEEDLLVNVTGGASSRSSTSSSSVPYSSGSYTGSSTFSDANSDFPTFVHSHREPIDLNIPNWVPGATPAKRRRIL